MLISFPSVSPGHLRSVSPSACENLHLDSSSFRTLRSPASFTACWLNIWKTHAAVVEGIQEKHAFSVILDHRLAPGPEHFLNESGVTFQQTKSSTQPDNPVNYMCLDTHTHTHIWLWPQTLIISFSLRAEDNKDTLSGQVCFSAFIHNTKLPSLTNGETNNSPFTAAIKQQKSVQGDKFTT